MVMFLTGRAGIRHVVRPLGRLTVKHPVRVNSDRKAGVVAEYDGDRIAHLGVNNRPYDPAALLSWSLQFERREGSVGVFAIDGLEIFPADSVLRMAQEHRLLLGEWLAGNRVIWIGGGEIPNYLIGGDKVCSLDGISCRWHKAESRNNHASHCLEHIIIPFQTELGAFIAASIQTYIIRS
jgi:hypothetical protein